MITLDAIELPEFIWQNRTGYSPWRVHQEYSLDGSQHIEVAAAQAGRSIVLFSEGEAAALFNQLETHAIASGAASFELVIQGESYNVMWDYSSQPVFGVPSVNYADQAPEFYDAVTLRLMTV
ncbi:hypothetical protein MJ923_14760 [Shewanella sp. 3B26]|uniref:Uncharacterized protein n=1 Tax=Shewanella zhuhaiensis TaxID=2919576 RepID=A0AAJ1F1G7_9GAMM|nr:hypothetical protein [Shewanella zhuhaiensis]MCH4295567.1 hypothetical protein [Shewanella zhuhaiensis]